MSVMKSKNAKWRTFLVVTALISWFAAIGAPQYSRSNKQSPSALDFMGTPPTPRPLFASMPAQSPAMIYQGPVQSSAAKSQFNTQRFTMADGSVQTRDELMQSRAGRQYLDAHDKTTPRDFVDGIVEGPIWEFVPVVGPIGAMIVEACDNSRYKRIKRRLSKGIEIPRDDAIYATYHEVQKNAMENADAGYRIGRFLKFGATWGLLLYILAPVLECLLMAIKNCGYKLYNKALPYLKRIGANNSKMPGVTLAAFILGYIDVMTRLVALAYNASSLALMVSLITLSLVVVANRRKNWARIVWTTWVGFGMACAFGLWAIGELRWPMLAFGSIAMSTALLICLWHPKTCEWFGKSC